MIFEINNINLTLKTSHEYTLKEREEFEERVVIPYNKKIGEIESGTGGVIEKGYKIKTCNIQLYCEALAFLTDMPIQIWQETPVEQVLELAEHIKKEFISFEIEEEEFQEQHTIKNQKYRIATNALIPQNTSLTVMQYATAGQIEMELAVENKNYFTLLRKICAIYLRKEEIANTPFTFKEFEENCLEYESISLWTAANVSFFFNG